MYGNRLEFVCKKNTDRGLVWIGLESTIGPTLTVHPTTLPSTPALATRQQLSCAVARRRAVIPSVSFA